MPKKCIKFLSEYLIPSLDNKRFGERLKWIDKNKNIFEMDWRHKAGPQWTEQKAQVFVEWDKHKGHFQPGNKEYYTQSKQRFRALLYKLKKEGQLKELPSKIKFKKVFFIGQKKNRRKKMNINAEYESYIEEEISSEEQEYGDPGAMICRKISEDEAANVLEDHPYSTISDKISGFLAYTPENEQAILSKFQDTSVPQSSESSSDNFHQKRVLVEQNYENLTTLVPFIMTSLYNTSYSSFEDWPENSTLSLAAANQNASVPGNMLVDAAYNPQQTTLSVESWLNGLC